MHSSSKTFLTHFFERNVTKTSTIIKFFYHRLFVINLSDNFTISHFHTFTIVSNVSNNFFHFVLISRFTNNLFFNRISKQILCCFFRIQCRLIKRHSLMRQRNTTIHCQTRTNYKFFMKKKTLQIFKSNIEFINDIFNAFL